jgi:hypothetical protein
MTEPVVDDTVRQRFSVTTGGATAKLVYGLDGDRLFLLHTEVPEEFRGQGVGAELVEAALARARTEGLTIVPWCPYARRWLKDHPDRIGDVHVDFRTPPPED